MQGKFVELGLIVENISNKQNLLQRSQFVIDIDDDINWYYHCVE